MVPGYKSDKPGKSPFMDMDLVPVYEDGSDAGVDGDPRTGYSGISLSPERQQAIGIRLGTAELRALTQTIRTVGRVTLDETLLYQVRTKFEGYVEDLFVDYTGKTVRKGEPLLSIYSPELLATQQEYLLAAPRKAAPRRIRPTRTSPAERRISTNPPASGSFSGTSDPPTSIGWKRAESRTRR